MLQEIAIGRLQLHVRDKSQHSTQYATRWRVTRQLQQTRLQPSHLPSSAILVIRRLAHETPFRPQSTQTHHWSRQLQQEVDRCARQAVRPYHQANAHLAPSVLFLDPVELLLCYTQDVLARRLPWYWPEIFSLIPAEPVCEQLLVGWLAYVAALPKLLLQLPPALTTQAVRQLEHKQIQQLLAAIDQHFGLDRAPLQNQLAVQAPRPGSQPSMAMIAATPPWLTWLPLDKAQGMQPLAVYLLGISHTLAKAPQVVYATSFMAQAAAWLVQQEAAWMNSAAAPSATDWTKTGWQAVRTMPAALEALEPGIDHQLPMEWLPAAMDSLPRCQNTQPQSTSPLEADSQSAANTPPLDSQERPTRLAPDQNHAQADRLGMADATCGPPLAPAEAQAPWVPMLTVHTALGGAFYLLNLITWLRRDDRLSVHEPTNLWVLVGVLMNELLGTRRPQHRADPLWGVLAMLADQPGAALAAVLYEEARNELAPAVEGWRQQYRTWIQAELTQRLTDDLDALAVLFCLPATLLITNTHLDVIMPLDAITIATRRAGLDCSPGWLPDFGYIVTIEFR